MNNSSEYWPDEPTIDFRRLFGRLWHRRWWIVATSILFTVASIVIALGMTRIYRSTTVVIPASAERGSLGGGLQSALGQFGGLASLAGINIGAGGDAETQEAIAVLKSRQFIEGFIHDRGLMPLLFPNSWDNEQSRWKAGVVPPTPAKAYKYFNKKICFIIEDKKTGLITLQIDWREREQAASWANELVARVNTEMRSRAIAQADASINYLERELKNTSAVATQDAINRLIESQIKQRMLANVTQEYAFRVVDRAMPSDKDDPVRPNRRLLVAVGMLLGFLVGAAGVLVAGLIVRERPDSDG